MTALMFVRFRPGVVGETRRTVHLVRTPAGGLDPSGIEKYTRVLAALCGAEFFSGEAEMLPSMGGMPCVNCLQLSPGPDDATQDESSSAPQIAG